MFKLTINKGGKIKDTVKGDHFISMTLIINISQELKSLKII